MTFAELGVSQEVITGLEEHKILEPTDIQKQTIPLILDDKDVVGISRTGSGKTAAFGIPLVDKVHKGKGVQGLVLAPTRELASQIARELRKFGKHKGIGVCEIYGGVGYEEQIDSAAVSEIIVATPGRLLDHIDRRSIVLDKLEIFVLDEADKMVEMGFIEDIRMILEKAPRDQQMLLFGATISREIDRIKSEYMEDVVEVQAAAHVGTDYLEQYYYEVEQHQKFSLLLHVIREQKATRGIIFCSTRHTVDSVAHNLKLQGIECSKIHGKLNQSKRLKVIHDFHENKGGLLVASAVAARGLDISGVTHVLNYDLAQDPQEYVHRVGRTARAGSKGVAYTLLSRNDHDAFRQILSRYPLDIKLLELPTFKKVRFERPEPKHGEFNRHSGNRRSFDRGPRRR